jgi:2-hydroxy-3-oxopropionate reductase
MIGGKESAVERAMPIFEKLGKNIVHVGEAGAGQVTKAANQMVVGTTIAIVGEALVLAAKAGVDPANRRIRPVENSRSARAENAGAKFRAGI